MAERVVVCDEAALRALPATTVAPALSGAFTAGQTAVTVTGTIDACRTGSERILSLSRLREIASAAQLADVDGAFQLAVHDPASLLLARDAIGHRTLFYAPKSPAGFAYASDIKTLLNQSGASRALDPRAFTLHTLPARAAALGADPIAAALTLRPDLPRALALLGERLRGSVPLPRGPR